MEEEEEGLQLVEILVKSGKTVIQTLALSGVIDNLESLGAGFEGIHVEDLPVIKDALRESLTRGVGTKISSETKGFLDREISLDLVKRSSSTLFFSKDVSTSSVEDSVDTSHGVLGTLDVNEVDGLKKTRLGSEFAAIETTTHGGDELTTSAMNGVSVKGDIIDGKLDTTHVLFAKNTFLGGPLEGGSARVLDLIEVLDSLGGIAKNVGTSSFRTKAPEFTTFSGIPSVLFTNDLGAKFEIVTGIDFSLVNVLSKSLRKRFSLHEKTIVLVGRLGETHLVRLSNDGFSERDDGRGSAELKATVFLLEILETDLNVKLTGTSDNVFTRFFSVALDTRIRLGKTTETLNEFGEIRGVLGLDSDTDDRRDRELHDTNVVGSLFSGDGSRFDEELINTDEGNSVTSRDIFDGFDISSHHENGTLDVLDKEIVLLAWNIVGTHDADLLTSADGSRKDTTESVEATLIRGGHHLGDVEHEGTIGITGSDSLGTDIIERTLIEELDTVALGLDG